MRTNGAERRLVYVGACAIKPLTKNKHCESYTHALNGTTRVRSDKMIIILRSYAAVVLFAALRRSVQSACQSTETRNEWNDRHARMNVDKPVAMNKVRKVMLAILKSMRCLMGSGIGENG